MGTETAANDMEGQEERGGERKVPTEKAETKGFSLSSSPPLSLGPTARGGVVPSLVWVLVLVGGKASRQWARY